MTRQHVVDRPQYWVWDTTIPALSISVCKAHFISRAHPVILQAGGQWSIGLLNYGIKHNHIYFGHYWDLDYLRITLWLWKPHTFIALLKKCFFVNRGFSWTWNIAEKEMPLPFSCPFTRFYLCDTPEVFNSISAVTLSALGMLHTYTVITVENQSLFFVDFVVLFLPSWLELN